MAGKKFKAALAQVELGKLYLLADAIELCKKIKPAKFDETVEVTMVLGVDPRKADQMVRGTLVLPHGLGKSKQVNDSVLTDQQIRINNQSPLSSGTSGNFQRSL